LSIASKTDVLMVVPASRVVRLSLGLLCVLTLAGHATVATPAFEHPLMQIDTSSPQATLRTFFAALEEVYQIAGESDRQRDTVEPLNRAVMTLDLSEVPPYLAPTLGPEAAIMLKEILDRIELPPFEDIPDREEVEHSWSSDMADAAAIERWLIPNTSIAIALMTEGPRSGEFLFTTDTVERIPEFFQLVRDLPYRANATPGIYEAFVLTAGRGLDLGRGERLPEWTKRTVGAQMIWQWIAAAAVLVAGAVSVIVLILVGRRWDLRLYARRKRRRDARQKAAPERTLPEPANARWWTLLSLLLSVGLIFAADWLLADIVNVAVSVFSVLRLVLIVVAVGLASWAAPLLVIEISEVYLRSLTLDANDTKAQFIRLGARALALVTVPAILVVAANLIGLPAYSVVTGLGIGGLAVALAAQGPLQDMFGALTLLARPLRIGDSCRFGDKVGTVESIGLRSTQIRTPERTLLMIPNSELSAGQLDVVGRRDRILWRSTLGLSLETTPVQLERVLDRLRQVVDDHEKVLDDPSLVRLTAAGPDALDVRIHAYITTTDWNEFQEIREDLLMLILREIEAAGTTLATPD